MTLVLVGLGLIHLLICWHEWVIVLLVYWLTLILVLKLLSVGLLLWLEILKVLSWRMIKCLVLECLILSWKLMKNLTLDWECLIRLIDWSEFLTCDLKISHLCLHGVELLTLFRILKLSWLTRLLNKERIVLESCVSRVILTTRVVTIRHLKFNFY